MKKRGVTIGLYLITLNSKYPPTKRFASVRNGQHAKSQIGDIIRLKFPSVTFKWIHDTTIYGYHILLSDLSVIELR